MNTKGMKFLAVLAVMALAFAVFAAVSPAEEQSAADQGSLAFEATVDFGEYKVYGTNTKAVNGTTTTVGVDSLGNSITVAYAAATDSAPETYTLTGTLAAQNMTGSIGMSSFLSDIVFNQTAKANDTKTYLKVGTGAWTESARFTSTTTEPWMIGIDATKMAAGYFYVAVGTAEPTSLITGVVKVDISGLTYAKEVTSIAELYSAVEDSSVSTIIVNFASEDNVLTKDLSTTKPIYFKSDCELVNGDATNHYKFTANLYTLGTDSNMYKQTDNYLKLTNVSSEHGALTIAVSEGTAFNLVATITENIGLDIKGTMEMTSVAGVANEEVQLFNGDSPLVAKMTAGSFKIQAPTVDGPVTYTFTDATATVEIKISEEALGVFLKDGDEVYFNTSADNDTPGVMSIRGTFIVPAGAVVANNAIIKPADTSGDVFINYGKVTVGAKGAFSTNTGGFATTSVPGNLVSSRTTTSAAPLYYTTFDILHNVFGIEFADGPEESGSTVAADTSFDNTDKTTSVATLTIGASKSYTIYGGSYTGDITLTAKSGVNETELNLFGVNYTGTVTGPSDATAVMQGVKGSLSFAAGSIAVLGEWDEGKITIDGKAKLTGNLVMKSGTTLVLNDEATLFLDGWTLTVEAGAKIQGYGKIDAWNISSGDDTLAGSLIIENSSDVDVDIIYSSTAAIITEYTQIATAVQSNNVLVLGDDIEIPANQTVVIPQGVTLYMNGYNITIKAKAELDVNKATILRDKPVGVEELAGASGQQIVVEGSFVLNTADVKTEVVVDDTTGYTSVSGAVTMKVSIGSESVAIGYGNTLIIEGVTFAEKKVIDVFGILEMSGNNTISSGGYLNVYKGATATIEGKLDISGTATIKGKLVNDGEITVKNTNGGAKLAVSGMFVNENKVTIQKAEASGAAKTNELDIAYAATTDANKFVNDGTLVITGILKGVVDNYSDFTFNGTAGANAMVRLYDGTSIQVSSVTGTLVVYDDKQTVYADTHDGKGVVKKNTGIVVDNAITLTNVKGIIVSESVSATVKEIQTTTDSFNVKLYVASMEVSTVAGSLLPLNDTDGTYTLAIASTAAATKNGSVWDDADKTIPSSVKGKITVDDMAVGKRVQVALSGSNTIDIAGEVKFVAEKSDINNTAAKAKVSGVVTIGPKAGPAGNGAVTAVGILHSGSYTVADAEANITTYYMPLATAIANAAEAEDKKIFIVGDNSISTVVPVAEDVYVSALNSSSSLSIYTGGVMTVASKGLLDMSLGATYITGKLIIMDKNTGLKQNTSPGKFVYEVYTENGDVATYTGVMGALEDAQSGTTITLQQDAYISESTVIKEGVKLIVPKNKTLTIGSEDDKVVLTVNGELDVESAGVVAKAADSEDIAIVINGVVASNDDLATSFVDSSYYDNYVMFESKLGGKDATYLSNFTYATENCDDGTLTIKGDLTAGIVAIEPGEKSAGMNIVFVQHSVSGTMVNSTLNVVSMSLDAAVTVNTANGEITGIILAATADEVASVSLKNATGIILRTEAVEDSEGIIDYLYVQGTLMGTMEITDGIVTLDGAFASANSKDSVLKVGADGALVVASGKTMTIAAVTGATSAQVTVAGSIVVNGTLTVNGLFSVSGNMAVIKDKSGDAAKVDLNKNTTITGNLIVSNDEVYGGEFNINSVKLTLGTAIKAVGASGSVIGPITIKGTGYICLFGGMDVSYALINWNKVTQTSEAVYTDIYIKGTWYVTAFALEDAVEVIGNVITGSTKIAGLDIANSYAAMDSASTYTYWFTDSALKTKLTTTNKYIGDKAVLYFEPKPAEVSGLVTVGTGIDLYIDGKNYNNEKYWGDDDAFTVGVHEVYVQVQSGYVDDSVTIKFNGAPVSNGKFTITADMESFTLVADGATPYTPEPTPTPEPEKVSEWNVTTILLLVLVILIAIMAVIVALRLNRS